MTHDVFWAGRVCCTSSSVREAPLENSISLVYFRKGLFFSRGNRVVLSATVRRAIHSWKSPSVLERIYTGCCSDGACENVALQALVTATSSIY